MFEKITLRFRAAIVAFLVKRTSDYERTCEMLKARDWVESYTATEIRLAEV